MVDFLRLVTGAVLLRFSWWVSLVGCNLYKHGVVLRGWTFRWLARTPTLTPEQKRELRRWA